MAKTHAHLHLVSAPRPFDPDLRAFTWSSIENVMWELGGTRSRAFHTKTTTRDETAIELYRAAEQLLVLAGRLRGFNFYAAT